MQPKYILEGRLEKQFQYDRQDSDSYQQWLSHIQNHLRNEFPLKYNSLPLSYNIQPLTRLNIKRILLSLL